MQGFVTRVEMLGGCKHVRDGLFRICGLYGGQLRERFSRRLILLWNCMKIGAAEGNCRGSKGALCKVHPEDGSAFGL